jgi:hypothetical protein
MIQRRGAQADADVVLIRDLWDWDVVAHANLLQSAVCVDRKRSQRVSRRLY